MRSLYMTVDLTYLMTVITVTTDVGELLNEELPLHGATSSETRTQSTHAQQTIVWKAGMHLLPCRLICQMQF